MNDEKHTILFTLVFQGTEFPVLTCLNQYYSLMTLISDRLALPGFGLCSGMGSCGTCMVEIRESYSNRKRHALSCGMQVNDDLANTTIIVELM